MGLYSIDIENFRGISKLKIEDFKAINLLVGKNNCGKTTVLEAIFLSIGVSNPQLAISIDSFRGIQHDDKDDFHFIYKNLDPSKKIQFKTQFTSPSQYRNLRIKPIFQHAAKSVNLKSSSELTATSTAQDEQQITGLDFEFSVKSLPQQKDKNLKSSIEFTTGGVKMNKAIGYEENTLGVFLNTRTMLQDVYERLDKIIQKKAERKLIKTLNAIDTRIVDISLGSKNMIYFDLGLDRLIPIQLMGDGVSRLLAILVAIANNENGIVLIDEIENGFHASTLRILWEAIKDAAIAYNVQVFSTTHSFECVRTFNDALSSDLMKDELIRLYRLEKDREGVSSAVKYDSELLLTSLESNWDIR